ncbi:hypothetical protein QWY79_10420 [Halomonas sabkhae]|uniref:DUF7694 domain-containing protein n=1 Tax=Halomonas sabkhae TaxID=626223 RepID=UPI0025B3F5D5|nr:hypothetical protein [Halomonas sabkhae]MDN3525677.1 hypothetical protein [Halomonas sabkhae]
MTNRTHRRLAKKQARKKPTLLTEAPRYMWPSDAWQEHRLNVWISCEYLVQVFDEHDGIIRLSINDVMLEEDGWADGMTWDELMEIKRQCGYADRPAVEIYPDDDNIVNVANMRHLWLLPEAPAFMWRDM